MPILIGCDPEFFLRDRKTQKIVPAYGKVPGTKQAPHKFGDGSSCHLDGMAVEIGISPAGDSLTFVARVEKALKNVRSIVSDEYEFAFEPAVHFTPEDFGSVPEECLYLGCEPDFNAYADGLPNPPPNQNVGVSPFLRTAAGHIHVGWGMVPDCFAKTHMSKCIDLVKRLDYEVGVPAAMYWDDDIVRRKLYGKPGAFRPKPYGVEYRTPSCAWLRNKSHMIDIFNWTLTTGLEYFAGATVLDQNERQDMVFRKLA